MGRWQAGTRGGMEASSLEGVKIDTSDHKSLYIIKKQKIVGDDGNL